MEVILRHRLGMGIMGLRRDRFAQAAEPHGSCMISEACVRLLLWLLVDPASWDVQSDQTPQYSNARALELHISLYKEMSTLDGIECTP